MSDAQDKRFEATPSRRRRAVREGNVARSAELTSVAAFGGAVLAATAAVPLAAGAAVAALHAALRQAQGDSVAAHGLGVVAVAALLPVVAGACAALGAGLAQTGGLHPTAIRIDLKRLDLIAGVKRLVGGEALLALARALLAFAAASAATWPAARDVFASGSILGRPGAAASLVARASLRACAAALAVGAAFAVADYVLARRRWLRGLKMSFEELKRDAKENDGDPQARARRKSVHRAVVRGGIGRTHEASFVVTNPNHVAIGLRYAPPAIPVPEIVVRALDETALRVRAIARDLRIPVVEDVALARLLYAQGTSGRAIPAEAYVAVAQVIAALAREGLLA